MLVALLVMAGILTLAVVVNHRRQPSRWDRDCTARHQTVWTYDAGGAGRDCEPFGGGCDGGDGGGGD